MFRLGIFFYSFPQSFPRARGDVPPRSCCGSTESAFSPRTRGCSFHGKRIPHVCGVFPAHAGMFRGWCLIAPEGGGFPRARGDVQLLPRRPQSHAGFSPRTRGCSDQNGEVHHPKQVFPAHAGMFLQLSGLTPDELGFPRARGDVPIKMAKFTTQNRFSPRTRGCSDKAQPKRVGA